VVPLSVMGDSHFFRGTGVHVDSLPTRMADRLDHWRRVAPHCEAVRCGPDAWTWDEFARRVRRNAARQYASGLQAGDRVAFLDKNGPALLETMMACMEAGTVMTPVNHRLTQDDIRYVLDDARPKVLFVGSEFLPLVETVQGALPEDAAVIVVGGPDDTYEQWLMERGAEGVGRTPRSGPGQVTARIYTGGTTDRPRAVLLTEDAVIAQVTATNTVVNVAPTSTGMVALPMFHVAALTWALHVVYYGGRTVIVRTIEPVALLDELVGQKVTHVPLVPPIYNALLQVPGAAEKDYSNLRALLYGAAPMPLPLLRHVLATFDAPVLQGYGMTETAAAITMLGAAEHRDLEHPHRLGSVGKPLPCVELDIIDPMTGERLDTQQIGEIRVRTPQLMTGYATRTEVDSTAISPDGWLRTGDIGYLDQDDYLFLVDRTSDIYLSQGAYVYPAQVEKVIVEHPAVTEAAVVGIPRDNGETSGTAFIVTKPESRFDPQDLRDYCDERLPSFQCPAIFENVPQLPRSAAGKVLKRLLRQATTSRHRSKDAGETA
jgi:acyl-CoA synthetase (AMP-forming)/AMP-acid ligase II